MNLTVEGAAAAAAALFQQDWHVACLARRRLRAAKCNGIFRSGMLRGGVRGVSRNLAVTEGYVYMRPRRLVLRGDGLFVCSCRPYCPTSTPFLP